ncbi:plant expansin, partial [Clavulina sp. PMI_390]
TGQHTGDGTWFNPGLGACGITNDNADLITAVSTTIYDTYPGYTGTNPNNNPICGHKLAVHHAGKTVTVKITDRCVACAEFDLDLSPGAFKQLAAESVGRIPITWDWL